MRRNGHHVNKPGAQSFDGPHRCEIVRVTRNRNHLVNRADEWGDGATCLQRVAAASIGLSNLEPDVSGAKSNMLGITDTKIEVADFRAIGSQDAKMVVRNEPARRLTWHNSDETQRDVARRQTLGRDWKLLLGERCGHG